MPESYTGPIIEENTVVDHKLAVECMNYMKDQKYIHKKYCWIILQRVIKIMEKEDNCVYVNIPDDKKFTVCGDVHGQYYDLLNIWTLNGYPSAENPYLFNGDFVDRGSFSVECILAFYIWK